MYLTFDEYQQFGGAMGQADFLRAEYAARMEIDALTHNRLREETPVREAVKMLALELVNRGYCGSLDGKETTSEGNGMVSASYESNQGKAEALVKKYLANETVGGNPLFSRASVQLARAVRA